MLTELIQPLLDLLGIELIPFLLLGIALILLLKGD